MEPTEAHIDQFRQLLTNTLEASTQDMRHIRFEKEDPQHLAVVCIYATVVQSTRECVVLLAHPTVAVGGMIRSIVESYADMCAAIDDSGYVENMLATFYAQSLSLLNNMIRAPTNPFHGDLGKKLD